jgi:hypothetical protein
MKMTFLTLAALLAAGVAQAGESTLPPKETAPPVTDDRWKFTLASPGWLAGVEGDVGPNGIISNVDLGFRDLVKRIDVQLDEYLADFTLRWRPIEGRRGYLDVLSGVRYTNLYQAIGLHPNNGAIEDASEQLVDAASQAIRQRLLDIINEERFRDELIGSDP